MAGLDYYANDRKVPEGRLSELFLDAVDRFGAAPALRSFVGDSNETVDLSYDEVMEIVRRAAGGLRAAGVARGDRVAILSDNRPEWAMADYACICAGVVAVPVYPTLVADQAGYIIEDAGARLVFAEDSEQVAKLREIAGEGGPSPEVVVFDPTGMEPGSVRSWQDFLEEGAASALDEAHFREEALAARAEDLTTLIYTSGTTGTPKGVMLTHANLFTNVQAAGQALPIDEKDITLSHLPLSHSFQRMVDYLLFSVGCTIAYAHDIRTMAADLKVVRPTLLVSVPRLYEKVFNAVMQADGLKGRLVRWARRVGGEWAVERLAGRRPGPLIRWGHAAADALVFKKIREGVGGRVRFFVSGSAPLEPEIAKFFYAAGVPILEGYGLTETSPVTNVNTLEALRLGTVGKPVANTEIRIAKDGEILIRGPQVMKGYFGKPEATAAVIGDDGWFATGDIGEIDDDGFLKITDRKKDLIVTAGGKNVAPQPIENRLKTNRYVEQVVMIGDKRKFCALLVVPAFEVLEAWCGSKGLSHDSREAMVAHPEVQNLMEKEVLGSLHDLASYERPKKLALLTQEFTIEDGTLTPTQKVKRRVVQERFDDLIDRFYSDENEDRSVLLG